MIVYVSIGNSDDKLTQADWSDFYWGVDEKIRATTTKIHGAWQSVTSARWQNACWCIDVELPATRAYLKQQLKTLGNKYHQDSIAWAEVPETEFL
jgi:hypothetical protein